MVGVSETPRWAPVAGNRVRERHGPGDKDERMIVFLEPPAQYDHPYPGQVVEQRLSRLQIIVTCHGPAESCSWLDKGVCHIVLPQEETDTRLIAYIREHEMGHCNGWPSHHPNARHIEYDPDAKNVPKNAAPKGNAPNNGHLKLELN
jgi:hypothetical protein